MDRAATQGDSDDAPRVGDGPRVADWRRQRWLRRAAVPRGWLYLLLLIGLGGLAWTAWRAGAVVQATIAQVARYEVLTAWPITQGALEVDRFRAVLGAHVAGEPSASWSEVLDRFEILWSRMPLLATEVRDDVRIAGLTPQELREVGMATVERVEGRLDGRVGAVGDLALLRAVDAELRPLAERLRHAAIELHNTSRELRASTLQSIIELGQRQGLVTLGFFVVVGVLLLVAFAETYTARRANQRAQAVALAARRAEQRFRHFADSASDWLWECDAELRLTFVSDRWRAIFGFTESAARGRRWSDLAADDVESAAWRRHLADLAARRPFRNFVFAHRTAAGGCRTAQLSASPVVDAAGRFLGYRGVGADITDRLAQERRIEFLARHDAMTGLLNRSMLHEELAEGLRAAERDASELALLLIDLDGFKDVNDTLGHDSGDALITAVAGRIRAGTRAQDRVARVGGDEFAVLIGPRPAIRGEAEAAAGRLIADLERPFAIDGHEVKVGASVGIALFPAHAATTEELLKAADLALYRAKAVGRRTFCLFSAELREALARRRSLERDLAEALAAGALDVHYQPIVRARDRGIVAVEALARWHHPAYGDVGPDIFVPIAEETGLIRELDRCVLERACKEAVGWRGALAEAMVAINLSPARLGVELLAAVDAVLASTGLSANRLMLEITETALMRDHAATRETLAGLRTRGVRLAIDDFGSGYSSLSYLRMFEIDVVKLDRGFLRALDDEPRHRKLLRVVVMLGHSLGLRVVAEGVETEAQLATLRAIGCDLVQGFLLGRPMPPAELRAWLAGQVPAAVEAPVTNLPYQSREPVIAST